MKTEALVLALLDNYYFRSRIEALAQERGVPVQFPADSAAACECMRHSAAAQTVAIVDLGARNFDALAAMQALRRADRTAIIIAAAPLLNAELIRITKLADVAYALPYDKLEEILHNILLHIAPPSGGS